MPIRILIADDDLCIRRLLHRILEARPGWEVCGEATNGNDAIAKAEQLGPDVVIMDLAMPKKNGLEAAREIAANSPVIPLLLLTVQEVSIELAKEACKAGFRGAVSKGRCSELVRAVGTLVDKGTFFDLGGSLSP